MIQKNVEKLLAFFPHNNPDLLARYHIELETQIYVRPGTEEQAHPTKNDCWSDGESTWKQVRWPYNAKTKPNFKDFKPDFQLAEHCESIGTTWWNWVTQESEGVVFDFDSIIGHQAGLSTKELKRIVKRLSELDYVTIIKSTSGNGYHVLVFFLEGERPVTRNHQEHTLVAEVVLQKMSEDAGFDLSDKVDCYGMIGWFWSTRATKENQGFTMVKKATRDLPASEVPDWTSLPAKRMKMRPKVVAYNEAGEEVDGNNILGVTDEVVVLDKDHRRIIHALEAEEFNFNHVPEYDLFHTHTTALKRVHRKLGLKGSFETSTSGSNLCNCFIRPVNGGGFSVYRFGKGTVEHQLWDQTTPTTWCSYNQVMPAHKVMLRMGAEYIAEDKQYTFESNEELVRAANTLGNRVPLDLIEGRQYALAINGRGLIVKCICGKDDKPANCDNWQRARGYHKKVLSRLEEVDVDSVLSHIDNLIRKVTRQGEDLGWCALTEAGWVKYKNEASIRRIAGFDVGSQMAGTYMAIAEKNPWTLVSEPFEREHLPGREWNKESAQLIQQCATEAGPHPHWDMVLEHTGQSWDEPLQTNIEMQKYGILTGADYLRAWIACMIRFPEIPLPYIFLVGPENSGKSVFHETLRKCISNGVVHGGNAFSSTSGFNGEFEGKVLVTIDEVDFSKNPGFIPKFKSWTNATEIQIHKKTMQPFDVHNYVKVVQTANTVEACPLSHGDTRMVIGEVPAFAGMEIPKLGDDGLLARCVREFPAFLYTLGTMQLPPMTGRTRLPVVSTEIKDQILSSTEPDSLEFLKAIYHKVPGQSVKLADAYTAYKKWCKADSKKPAAPNDFKLQIGLKFPVHKGPKQRALSIGNLSINQNAEPSEPFSMEGKDGRHARCIN